MALNKEISSHFKWFPGGKSCLACDVVRTGKSLSSSDFLEDMGTQNTADNAEDF